MLPAVVRRLRKRVGRRGKALILLGTGKVCFGLGVIAAPPPARGLNLLLRYGPLCAWALVWVVSGVIVFLSALLPIGRDRLGFIVACVPPLIWAVAYGTAAAEGIYPRGAWVFGWYMTSHIGVILWASSVPEYALPHHVQQGARSERSVGFRRDAGGRGGDGGRGMVRGQGDAAGRVGDGGGDSCGGDGGGRAEPTGG
jgi:hypothetical protein